MMTTIQIDDRTAEGLAAMAQTQGVTVQVFRLARPAATTVLFREIARF